MLLPSNGIHVAFMCHAVFAGERGCVLYTMRDLRPWIIGTVMLGGLYCAELSEGSAADTRPSHMSALRAPNTTPHTA
jgi:hypothetical protein